MAGGTTGGTTGGTGGATAGASGLAGAGGSSSAAGGTGGGGSRGGGSGGGAGDPPEAGADLPEAGATITPDASSGPGPVLDGGPGGPARIVLVAAGLQTTFGVAVDPMSGDLYSAEYGDNRIRRIQGTGPGPVVVGPGATGAGGQLTMNRPHDLRFQPGTRNLFIADTMGGRVLRFDAAAGEVAVFAGGGGKVPAGGRVYCLAFDARGETLYFTLGEGIRLVDLKTETVKATIPYGNARVIAVDSQGTLYAVKNGGNALQTVTMSGQASNVPGGSPVRAPKGLVTDREDNLIIVDTESHSILKWVAATRSIVRLVGNGMAGTGRLDGPPEQAQTDRPHGAFVEASGRILIADSFNDRILGIVR